MAMNEHIHPYHGKHSIKEAVISFFVQPNIVAPEYYRDLLVGEGFIKQKYQKFEIIKEVSVDLSLEREIQMRKVKDAGFKLTGFLDGKTSKVIQCINQPTRTVFTFNELMYERWEIYLPEVMSAARQIAQILPAYKLMAFSLMYIDEFYFDERLCYNAKELFNLDSRILPKGLDDSPLVDYHLVLNKEVNDQNYTDDLNIKVLDTNSQKTIRIINSLTFPLTKRMVWYSSLGSDEIMRLLEYAHQSNKELLNDILNKEIGKEIGVCVC